MGGEQGQGGRDMVAVWRVCRSSELVCVMRRLMCGLRVRVRELRSDVRTIVDERERCKEWAGGASGSTESGGSCGGCEGNGTNRSWVKWCKCVSCDCVCQRVVLIMRVTKKTSEAHYTIPNPCPPPVPSIAARSRSPRISALSYSGRQSALKHVCACGR